MPEFLKIVLVGDEKAGKTALCSLLTGNRFPPNYQSTVGATYSRNKITLKDTRIINTYIWDTAGRERYQRLSNLHIKDANVIIYCIDLEESLDYQKIQGKIKHFKQESGSNPRFILVGTKSDLCPNDETILSEIQSNISEADSIVITSAKNNVGLDILENAISTQLSSLEEQENQSNIPEADSIVITSAKNDVGLDILENAPSVEEQNKEQAKKPGLFPSEPNASTDQKMAKYLPSQFSEDLVATVVKHIETLQKEINSFWPYPNKDRKREKINALEGLLEAATNKTTDLETAINSLSNNSSVRKGHLSTRTADLLDRLLDDVKSQKKNFDVC